MAIKEMTEVELAWLAGLLEGEGTFTYADPGTPSVEVKMTDLDVIQRVAVIFGVKPLCKPAEAHGWQDQYRVRVRGGSAVGLMRTLLPHMGRRRSKRIQELLDASGPFPFGSF